METRRLSFRFLVSLLIVWGLAAAPGTAQDVTFKRLETDDVNATDGAFEDKVQISWPALGTDSAAYEVQIYRDTTTNGSVDGDSDARIGIASSEDSVFTDTGGDPGVAYEYCVIADDGSTEDGPYCDEGFRELNEPVNVRASDRTETGRIQVDWADRSTVDDGYRVERDGHTLLRTEPSAQKFVDTVQTAGHVAVDYLEADTSAIPSFETATLSGVTDRMGLVATPRSTNFALRLRSQVQVPERGVYDFELTGGQRSRLRVDGEVVVGTQETSGTIELESGARMVVVEYLQGDGEPRLDLTWAGPSFDARPLSRERLSVPTDELPGAKAAYYSYYEGDFGGALPNFDSLDPVETGANGRLSTGPAGREADYALRYRATLQVSSDTTYTFYTTSDGASRLQVNGQTVVSEHTGEGRGTIGLEAGTHSLVVDYARGTGDENLTVEWEGPVDRTEIPFTALSLNRVEHRYCLTTVDPEGFTSGRRCATGAGGVAQPPNDVQASDGQYDDRIFLSWVDNVEDAGFRVYRREIGEPDSVLVGTTVADAVTFADEEADVGTAYRYCVHTQTPNGLVSRPNCDRGIRARLPTPGFFQATTGVHDDRIELTWADPSSAEDGYNVYRRPQDQASESFQLADTTPGASFEYLEGTFDQLPAFDEQAPDSAGVAETIGTGPAQRDANVALRYRAALQVPESGTYTFYTRSDDGSRLLIDGETVVDNGGVHDEQTASGDVQLDAGTHALTVTYFHTDGTPTLSASWSGPSFDQTPLEGDAIAPDLGERIAQLPANRTELTDEAVDPGPRYVYHVVGTATDGGRAMAAATVGRRAKVIAPETVSATDSTYEERVQIEWESKATRASIYRVYRDGERIKTVSDPQQSYSDSEPVADTRHRYCVEAVTDGGVVSDQTCDYGSRHLKAPSELAASDGTEEDVVRLTWSNNSNVAENVYVHRRAVGEPAPHGISYEYVEGSFQGLPSFDNLDPDKTGSLATFALDPAEQGNQFAFRYRAALDVPAAGEYTFYLTSDEESRLRVNGETVADNASGGEGSGQVTLGQGPHALTVEYVDDTGDQTLSVEWAGPSTSRAEIGSGDLVTAPGALVAQLPALLAEYTDPTAVPGKTYAYGVYVDGGGPGRSDTTANTGSRVFNAPTDVQATDGAFERKVDLRWSDESQAETGYEVYRKNPSTGDSTRIAQLKKDATSYVDDASSINVGEKYVYTVVPRDRLGAVSPTSDSGSTALQAPRSVRAAGYQDEVGLSWEDVSDAEGGYRILRDGSVLDTTGVNVASYIDSNTFPQTEYEYCVQTVSNTTETDSRCVKSNSSREDRLVTTSADGARSVYAADLDGDGDQDILSASADGDEISWYENFGNGGFSDQKNITKKVTGPQSVYAADLDGDGDQDVLSASYGDDKVAWYENDGTGGFSGQKVISNNALAATSVKTADLDGDGDQDVLSAAALDFTIAWYENQVGENGADADGFGAEQRINESDALDAFSVATADLDGDGDPDVLSASSSDDKIAWYENEGGGSFSETIIVNQADGPADGARSVDAADLNGDGAQDILSASENNGRIAWYENNGSNGFSKQKVISANFDQATSTYAADLDRDGDMDVLAASRDKNIVVSWFENKGMGEFSGPKGLRENASWVPSVYAADFGGSPRPEVLSGSRDQDKITVHFKTDVSIRSPLAAPDDIQATDGTNEDKVRISWTDKSNSEEGYRIYRNGEEVGTVSPDVTRFDDTDARAGSTTQYCVATYDDSDRESRRKCDYGYRPPDGALTGRVTTQTGTGVSDVDVCLAPPPGRGLQLDGEGGVARTASRIPLSGGDFTISFWAKRAATGQDTYALSQGESTANRGLHIGFRSSDQFTFAFWDNDLNTSETYTSREWHHWAVTYDRSTGDRVIYRDGTPVASDQATSPYEGTGRLDIGDRADGAGHFQGHLDEIRVWDRVRSDSAITADMRVSLSRTEDELTAYWPVEKGTADALVDPGDEDGERYAVFEGGAHRGEAVAPLEICAETGNEGNYELGGIRYGHEATFEVTPSRGNRTFKPGFKDITLSSENPVQNEVEFNDVSSFAVKGRVQIAGTQCPVTDLQMAVDDRTKAKTDSDGDYSVTAQAGQRTIAPKPSGDRTFDTAEQTFFVRADTAGVNFVDETTRTVSGQIGGGSCGIPIGEVTLSLEAENGCYSKEVTIDTKSADGSYEISGLPPLVYNVRVERVENTPANIAQSDVLTYFKNNFGTERLDLTEQSDTLDVIYRAPLTVDLKGLPTPNSTCSDGLQVEDETVANVPVLSQGPEPIPYEVRVAEDYGGGRLCPVDSATVRVFDEWAGRADEAQELTVEDGVATDSTMAKLPSFTSRVVDEKDRTYQQRLSAVAEVGGKTATTNKWGLITGQRTRQGTDFVTGSTGPIPVKILRDPPGDGSSAFLEEGSSVCRSLSTTFRISNTIGTTIEAGVGYDAQVGFIGFYADQEIETRIGASLRATVEALNEETLQLCMTTQEGFSTSDDDLFTGASGDVFIGTGMNLLFTEMDVLKQEEGQSCKFDRFTKVGYQPTGFETAYTFSQYHIENSLIPRLSDLMDDARRRLENGDPAAEERLVQLKSDSLAWESQLRYNDALKAEAKTRENRSFDAGAEYTYSRTSEETESYAVETSVTTEIEAWLQTVVDIAGNGFNLEVRSSTETEAATRNESTFTDTRTVGYTLSDDDIGDYFSVDVKEDPVFNTPVFELRGGQSSCPWEGPSQLSDGTDIAGTVPRYKANIQTFGSPEKTDVPPDEMATFEVALTNDSQSDDPWRYKILPISSSNPDGAQLSVNGAPLSGQDYFLQPGEDGSTKITLGVERGPYGYRYEDLQVKMVPPCEQSLWEDGGALQQADTLSLSVQYDAPCTDVQAFRPQENWTVNRSDSSLKTILTNFSLTRPKPLGEVGLQYRRTDQEGWTDAFRVPADTVEASGNPLADDTSRYEYVRDWDAVTNIPDGNYQVRAYSQCPSAEERVYSAPAKGVKDTKRPEVLSAPKPADEVLAFGDDISVTFTEPVDCESVVSKGEFPTALLYTTGGDTLSVNVRCNGERIIFEPAATVDLASYEDSTLTAEIKGTYRTTDGTLKDGIVDKAGNRLETDNPLTGHKTWSFEVRRRSFAWKDASTTTSVDFEEGGSFTDVLANGSPENVVFDLESLEYGEEWPTHPWLSPEVTDGTVPAGGTQPIDFAVSDTLAKGTYQDTVRANSAIGAQDLGVRAKVTCQAPYGTPPEGAAYTMSVTATLNIPGDLGGSGLSTDSLDQVAAFVGNELRGVASLEEAEISGQTVYRAFLTVRSDRRLGETVTFRVWDGSQCRSFFAEQTVPFRANDAVGSPGDPKELIATKAAAQSVPLAQGWTWISVNTLTDDSNAVNTVLSTVVPSDGDVVKSQDAFSQYSASEGNWVGSLEQIEPGRGYLVRTQEPSSLVLLGDSVAGDQEINLEQGWNWLGYLPQRAYPVDHALKNLAPTPANGDIIKGQNGFAQYVNEKVGWLGSLETLRPGRGYFLQLDQASTLSYPTEAPKNTQVTVRPLAAGQEATSGSEAMPSPPSGVNEPRSSPSSTTTPTAEGAGSSQPMTATGASPEGQTPTERATPAPPTRVDEAMPEWSVASTRYPQTMTVVADVKVDGDPLASPKTRLGAFIDGEVRGVARPVKLPDRDAYRVFLLVHGDAEAERDVSFRLFNPKTGRIHETVRLLDGLPGVDASTPRNDLPSILAFDPTTSKGTVEEPVLVNAGDLPEDYTPSRFQLKKNYPNPVTRRTTVEFALPRQEHVSIEVYDLLGRRVKTTVSESRKAGWHQVTLDARRLSSGVYFYRLEAGSFRKSHKMVVVK